MVIDELTTTYVKCKEENESWRRTYINTTAGRAEVENELTQELQDQIFAIWGDAPTVEDPYTEESNNIDLSPSANQRIALLQNAVDFILMNY